MDPGFPVQGGGGGHQPPMQARFVKMYVKTKELGPVVGKGEAECDRKFPT